MSRPGQSPLEKGTFVVSLDFELAWGTRGRHWADLIGEDLDGTRRAIDGLLEIFERYDLSATWVVVGAMFLGGDQRHPWLADSEFDDVPCGDCGSQPHWYAEDILSQLRETVPAQDIGCHTLTHMFVETDEVSRQRFDLELARSVELFGQLGLSAPRSFIYPKHFMAHFDLLKKHGIACYRGPEAGWFEQLPTKHLRAAGRLASAKVRQRPSVDYPYRSPEGLWVIPSSQFYPSFRSVGKYVSVQDRIAKAIRGLEAAARKQAVFHLWTHPFNMGVRTDELIFGWNQIVGHAARLRDQQTLQFRSMSALAEDLEANG